MPRSTVPIASCALLALIALAGCESSGARAYYQTRYIPSSADQVYASHEKAKWHGDLEVYELPSAPPALEEHRPRNNCERPGVRFKAHTIGGYGDEPVHGADSGPAVAIAAYDKRPQPVSALPPDKTLPKLVALGDLPLGPTMARPGLERQFGYDDRTKSTTGVGLGDNRGDVIGALGEQPKEDYCMPAEVGGSVVDLTK